MLCTYCILKHSGFWHIRNFVHSGIFRHFQAYSALLWHIREIIKTYSSLLMHIQNHAKLHRGIFRTLL